jgi:glutamate-1-semialdehyde 2,1-aminomutase
VKNAGDEPARDERGLARAADVLPAATINDFALPDKAAFIVSSASGPMVTDTTGREYIDYLLGSGPLVLGHAHPAVVSAIVNQITRGTTYYMLNRPAIELAERLVEHVPCAERVRFAGDGSEAVFYAMRIARAATGRRLVIKFEGGFHGHTDYALQSFHPVDFARYPKAVCDSAGIPPSVADTVLVAPFNNLMAFEAIVDEYADDIAAVVVEPVQRAIEPLPGFLAGLRSACDRIGALLVFDEVVTGFRLDMGGAQTWYGVEPHLCALGKVIGGGLPLAAVVGLKDLMDYTSPIRPSDQRAYVSGTLNGNPLSCAAGLATIEVIERIDACRVIGELGGRLAAGLRELLALKGIVGCVIGPPAFAEVVFGRESVIDYREYAASDRDAAAAFGVAMIARGILMRPGAKMYISAVHAPEHIGFTLGAADEALDELLVAGVL